jgi:pyruvate,water dikinase
MTNFVFPFTNAAVTDVAVGGGKGARLAALAQAGFPVPTGAVVVPQAYREFMEPLQALIRSVTDRIDPEDHRRVARAHETIGAAAERLAVPLGVAREIERWISAEESDARWAVRSSGTAEDMAGAAFAGQHDTFLNCIDARDVIDHVRRCWLSLWSARAIAYRARLGIAHTEVAMAVVLQRMIFSDVAGVGFSIDPVTGLLDRVIINANFGLGESVVSGEGDVDHLVVVKASGRIVEAHVAPKRERVIAAARGTIEVHVDAAEAARAALTETDVSALTGLLRRVEDHYGWPQDIEWAIAGGQLWLLQSRPITTVPARWTRDESAERFPDPVSPFTWDFVEDGFHRSLNHSFTLMGLPAYSGKWFARFDGYVYGNQNAVELYARRSPAPQITSLGDLERHLPALLERFAWLRELPSVWHAALPTYLEAMDAFAGEPLETYTLGDLWDFIERLNGVGTEYFLPNIAISIGHGVLHRALNGLLTLAVGAERAADMTHALVQCETMTTRVNAELRELAAVARNDSAVVATLRNQKSEDAWETGRWTTSAFWIALRGFLDRHGHRETHFDAMHPTWGDAPWVVLDQIRALLDAPVDQGERAAPRADVSVLQTQVTGQLVPALRQIATGIIELAREYTALDDLEHYHTTRLSPPMRRAVLEVGHRLVAAGLLSAPIDAFFASKASLRRMCIGDVSATDRAAFVTEVRANRAAHAHALAQAPVWELGSSRAADLVDADRLTGIAGSPGVAEGTVYIVRGVEDFAAFPKGAVLVTRTTSPAWTSLFYSAAALVTESGGPLSHGAVTAREMGIPAVMAARGVLSALANGDRVRVDGATGVVHRLSSGASAGGPRRHDDSRSVPVTEVRAPARR